jgi:hypothetical protein
MVHPHPGATPTNSSSLFLSVNIIHAQSHDILFHRGQEICVHSSRSSFPELQHKASSLVSYNHLHLSLQVINIACTKHLQVSLNTMFSLSSIT